MTDIKKEFLHFTILLFWDLIVTYLTRSYQGQTNLFIDKKTKQQQIKKAYSSGFLSTLFLVWINVDAWLSCQINNPCQLSKKTTLNFRNRKNFKIFIVTTRSCLGEKFIFDKKEHFELILKCQKHFELILKCQ